MTLTVRCFRLLSSMCRTSEIDGRYVHLRGSDRCEISYVATLTRSMCRSKFEDPIGVNFIIFLLYGCMRSMPRVCTLVLFIINVTVAVPCACVCVSVRCFLPPRASTPRNIGTYVFTATQKTLYNYSYLI